MADILVIDDDEPIRESLCALLEDEGHRVTRAAKGAEALVGRRAQGHPLPCLNLLDLMIR